MKKPDKIKLIKKQRKVMAENKGHNYDESATEFLIENHDQSGIQEDGRRWFRGPFSGRQVLTICSATVSGAHSIFRVVTTHIRPKLGRRHRSPED